MQKTGTMGTSADQFVRALIELTKPRITLLLMVTCASAMVVAWNGIDDFLVLIFTLCGFALNSGGASTWNHVLDRDIDGRMSRTSLRPMVVGSVPLVVAQAWGTFLLLAGAAILVWVANPLAALLSVGGGLYYVIVYTVWLKRRSAQNIVIGGAAGAAPALVGWDAATGELSWVAWFMFLVVFVWTPPHFWSLALLIRQEYSKAGVPMLPVIASARSTSNQVWWYTVALSALMVAPVISGSFGLAYGVPSLTASGIMLWLAWRLRAATRTDDSVTPSLPLSGDVRPRARAMFLFSMLWLAIVFLAMVVDAVV